MSDLDGKMVRHFLVIEKLAQGGSGEVFKAFDTHIKRYVALKIMFAFDDLTLAPDFFERFRQEARIAGNLHHENLVEIYEMGEWQGRLFLVMELVEGRSLEAVIRDHDRLAPADVVDLVRQICGALKHVHYQNVAHLDLKPANIMVTDAGRVKLLDFGIATMLVDRGLMPSFEAVMATPLYSGLAVCEGRAGDHRDDVFTLGLVCHELLTGCRPRLGLNTDALLQAIGDPEHEQESRLSSSTQWRRNPLEIFFWKALHPKPELRFQSVVLLEQALVLLLEQQRELPEFQFTVVAGMWDSEAYARAAKALCEAAAKSQSQQRRAWRMGIAALLLLGLVVPTWHRFHKRTRDQPSVDLALASQAVPLSERDQEPADDGVFQDADNGGTNIHQEGSNNTAIGRDLNIYGLQEAIGDAAARAETGAGPDAQPRKQREIRGNPNLRPDFNVDAAAQEVARLSALVTRYAVNDPEKALYHQMLLVEMQPGNQTHRRKLFGMLKDRLPENYDDADLAELQRRFPEESRPLLAVAQQRAWRSRCLPPSRKILDFLLLSEQDGGLQRGRGRYWGRHYWINDKHAAVKGGLEYHYTPNLSPYDRFKYLQRDGRFVIESGFSAEPLARDKFPRTTLLDVALDAPAPEDAVSFDFLVILDDGEQLQQRRFHQSIPSAQLAARAIYRVQIDNDLTRAVFLIPQDGFPLSFADARHNTDFHSGRRLTRNDIRRLKDLDLFEGPYFLVVTLAGDDGGRRFAWVTVTVSAETKMLQIRSDGAGFDDQREPYQAIASFFAP